MALDVVNHRLHNQRLSTTNFKTPKEVVNWLGAVQAQDYAGAKWALGQRLKDSNDTILEQAFTDGSILRTHLLRPTWHFITPEDIRWLLMLTAPRVHTVNAFMYRQTGLDKRMLRKGITILEKELQNGKQLTRDELASALEKAGIPTDNLRSAHLMMYAELEGIICSGARRGKQFTYALLEERVPPTKAITRDEALTELAKRYFTSRGPATLKDFTWWSGLTTTDARIGIEMVKSQFVSTIINDQTYWFRESESPVKRKTITAHLLPNYDEYIVGYTDRSLIHNISHDKKLDARGNVLFQNTIMINGRVTGTWKRTLKKSSLEVELNPFNAMMKTESQAVTEAIARYGKFIELPVKGEKA